MPQYFVGSMIYENRVRQGITQEKLCAGICTPATLSKIENGAQMPRRKTYEALMQRLGMPVNNCIFTESSEDLIRSNLEYVITRKLAVSDYQIEDLLEQYRACGSEMEPLEKQFYKYALAIIEKDFRHDIQKSMELFWQAIRITMPDFSITTFRNRLLTFSEIIIINNIAILCHRIGKKQEAQELMFQLKQYMEQTVTDPEEKARIYPMLLFNLSNLVGELGKNELAYELCDTGIEYCITCGKLTVLPLLIFNKAYSLLSMNRAKEALPYFQQAATLFEVIKDNDKAHICKLQMERCYEEIDIKSKM